MKFTRKSLNSILSTKKVECFFCKKGYVNNCTDENGGWALGCRIDGGQAEYVRVPFADQGLNKIPEGVTDRQALLVGDVLGCAYF